MSEHIVTPEDIARLKDAALARRALKWILEHRVYYDRRSKGLIVPASVGGNRPLAAPPDDVALYLFELTTEVDLEAEHAS